MFAKNVQDYYKNNPQYLTRLDTDKFIPYPDGSFKFSGIEDAMAKFVQDFQLMDEKYWKAFVNQFRKGDADLADVGWRGEYWGKMMRGAAVTYLYTQDEKLYALLENTTRDLLTTQDADGRFATYPKEAEYQHWDVWSRKYIALGLLHFCEICKDDELKEQILAALEKHLDYIINTVGPESEGKKEIYHTSVAWLGINSSSILEPFMRMYNQTRKKKYLDFAEYIVNSGAAEGFDLFETAASATDAPYKWPVRKAYEMMSCFEGLIEYYRVTGNEKYKDAVINFAQLVKETDISIIGCSGCEHELFDHSSATQTWTKNELIMQENCVTVTWIKFCYQLLCLTGDSSFADEIEKATYNALYGAVNTEKSTNNRGFAFDSYSPLLMQKRGRKVGGYKKMENGEIDYGCCAAIGAVATGMIPQISAQITENGIVINLYINGEMNLVTPKNNALQVLLDTKYPTCGNVDITVNPEMPETFEIMFRIPGFSKNTVFKINGEEAGVLPGTYVKVKREWCAGDKITINMDMTAHVLHPEGYEEDEDSKSNIAVKYGPLVLARDARLSDDVGTPVDLDYDENDVIKLKPSFTADFPTLAEFEVPQRDGSFIKMVDYQSAGKTWDYDSATEAWMPTKKYPYYVNLIELLKNN